MIYRLFIGLCCITLAPFAAWALVDPASMMEWIGFHTYSELALIEFRCFYGGLELALIVFLLLPETMVMRKAKLANIMLLFGCIGLTRLLSLLTGDLWSTAFIAIGVFEIAIASAALALLAPEAVERTARGVTDPR